MHSVVQLTTAIHLVRRCHVQALAKPSDRHKRRIWRKTLEGSVLLGTYDSHCHRSTEVGLAVIEVLHLSFRVADSVAIYEEQ